VNAWARWLPVPTRLALAAAERWAPGRLSVLIFHRVLAVGDPLFPSEMDATRFDALMGLVARTFNVLSLGEAAGALASGCLPPRALSITFDDGYADNVEIALPILQRHGLKATFFIATGFLDGGRMFNDTVIETLRAAPARRVDLGEWGLGAVTLGDAASRRAAIDRLLPKVKYLGLGKREEFLARLAMAVGRPSLPPPPMMRSTQVQVLDRAGMEIGGHTVHHPILRLLDDTEATAEIARGRRQLQDLTDSAVDLFAYPNGRPGQDYDQRHVEMVHRLGFRAAVSTFPGTVDGRADRFQMPRFTPWDRGSAAWVGRLVHSRMARPAVAAGATASVAEALPN
jgi:peptidoglycan/xylan/chitin deacetylase (PgdA/CDA1 family)